MARPRTGGGVYPAECKRHGTRACWRIVYYDHTGTRRFQRVHGVSKPEAREVWQHLSAQALLEQAGAAMPAERVTVRDYARDIYLPDLEASGLKMSTVEKRIEVLETHILPMLGALRLSELSTSAIQKLRQARVKRGPREGELVSPSTLHGLDRALSAMVHHAAARGYFGDRAQREEEQGRWVKPWRSIQAPKAQVRPQLASLDDFGRVIRAAVEEGGLRLGAAFVLAAVAGLRRGELGRVNRGHVTLGADGVDLLVTMEKTGTVRPAHLRGEAAELIRQYVESLGDIGPGEPIFPSTRRTRIRTGKHSFRIASEPGDRMRGYVVSDAQWARVRARAALPENFRFHDLRGAMAKYLSAHLAEADVQRAMGHESPTTTRIYLRTTRDAALQRAAEAFAQLQLFGELGDEEVAE